MNCTFSKQSDSLARQTPSSTSNSYDFDYIYTDTEGVRCSRGGGPDQEALLSDVEVNVTADLMSDESTEVAA